ncbi:MAG: hypothetical protein HY717_20560 [Planctomycetes bacterium]|nr:hypothetical protein [Planctomycetota bacterium]
MKWRESVIMVTASKKPPYNIQIEVLRKVASAGSAPSGFFRPGEGLIAMRQVHLRLQIELREITYGFQTFSGFGGR